MKKDFSLDETKVIAAQIGLDFTKEKFAIDQLQKGLSVELEHGAKDSETNVTNDDFLLTGKIAWAHLREYPDYYDRLDKLELEAEAFWQNK